MTCDKHDQLFRHGVVHAVRTQKSFSHSGVKLSNVLKIDISTVSGNKPNSTVVVQEGKFVAHESHEPGHGAHRDLMNHKNPLQSSSLKRE